MELKPDLVGPRRIVGLGNDERVFMLEAVECAVPAELKAARHVGLIVAPVPHARQRVFERDAGLQNRVDAVGSGRRIGCGPERSERTVDGRCRILRRRTERNGKAEATTAAQGRANLRSDGAQTSYGSQANLRSDGAQTSDGSQARPRTGLSLG